jgi:hypothetical protein
MRNLTTLFILKHFTASSSPKLVTDEKPNNTLHFETFKVFFNTQVRDEKPNNTLHFETFYGFIKPQVGYG